MNTKNLMEKKTAPGVRRFCPSFDIPKKVNSLDMVFLTNFKVYRNHFDVLSRLRTFSIILKNLVFITIIQFHNESCKLYLTTYRSVIDYE